MKNDQLKIRVALAGIVVLGLSLRLYRLGALGFSGNEDYLVISVEAILDGLLPRFPSGVIYPRALPHAYVVALFAKLFGASEFVLRLPGALFSTASIPLVYLLGRRLLNPVAGLVAALLLAGSDWEVAMAHTARMYSMLSFFLLASVLLYYRSEVEGGRRLRAATLGSILITCFLHKLALVLLPMVGCLAFFFWFRKRRLRFAAVCMVVVAVGFTANYFFEDHHYDQFHERIRAQRTAHDVAASDLEQPGDEALDIFKDSSLSLFLQAKEYHRRPLTAATIVIAVLLVGSAVGFVVVVKKRILLAAMFLVLVALYFQQSLLAVLVLCGFVLVAHAYGRQHRIGSLTLLVMILAGFVIWGVFGMLVMREGGWIATAEGVLRAMLSYPSGFLRVYLSKYPLLSGLALVAGAITAARYLKTREVSGPLLLVMLFAVPTLVLGFHPKAMEKPFERYVFILNPLFLMLVSHAATSVAAWLSPAENVRSQQRTLRWAAVWALALVLIVLTQFGGVQKSVALTSQSYGLNEDFVDRRTGRRVFNPDHKGPSLFVKEHWRQGDIVIAMDVLAFRAYNRNLDYQLTLSDKRDAEGWIGAPHIETAEGLSQVLNRFEERCTWIVMSGEKLAKFAKRPEMIAMLQLVHSRGGPPRYTARDGTSLVYLVCGTEDRLRRTVPGPGDEPLR